MYQNSLAKYPHYVKELIGLSLGSDVPMKKLLMINFKYELKALLQTPEADECTDILVSNPDNIFIAHNEDNPPDSAD